MDSFLLKLCWKNIWRSKRRSLLAINAIAVGAAWLVWIHNYVDAFNEQIIENAIRYQSGHVMISASGFHENKPIQRFLKDSRRLEKWLASRPEVRAHSSRVQFQGLVSSAAGSANVWFQGVDPKRERKTTRFASVLVGGSFLNGDRERPIVIGAGLAELLKARVGSKLVVLTHGADGSIGNELFRVSGIFESHTKADKSMAFIRLEDARMLASLPRNATHQVSVLLKQDGHIPVVKEELSRRFGGKKVEVMTWMEAERHLMAQIDLFRTTNRLLMFIILFIAAVGIANSILMGVMERTREFGVMMAIGTSRAEMVRMVFLETLLVSLVGIGIGNLLGTLVTLYFGHTGFDLQWFTSNQISINGNLLLTVSYPQVNWVHNMVITVTIVALSSVAAAIPIHHISRLRATVALRAN